MQVEIALASGDNLPKGSAITGYEIRNPRSNRLLEKGSASKLNQILKRIPFVATLGMTVEVTINADCEGKQIKVKQSYTNKSTGPVKA